MRTRLATPPIPCIVHATVFDAFAWHPSESLEWLTRDGLGARELPSSKNPPGLGFVLRGETGAFPFLPREDAHLHLPGVPLPEGATMLAPWAIDDATDLLYETRTPPNDALALATTSLAALYWGLHDWAHFHSHGPFVEIAATELQCDASALAWLAWNAETVGLDDATFDALCRFARALGEERCAAEGVSLDLDALSPRRVTALLPTPEGVRLSAPGGAR